jgi:polyisoprenoid-binding protein YceI
MKNFLIRFLITFVSCFSLAHAAENYTIDSDHSYVEWKISHFDFSNPSGKWYIANGTITLDKNKPQDSKVNIKIKIADIITGIPELDKHLKGELFFDVAKFPEATFVSDKVTLTGKNTAKVHGILTVHGVSKPITLMVKLNKIGTNPINNKETVGFSALVTLNRSDYGISALLPGLGDKVQINIETEAFKG